MLGGPSNHYVVSTSQRMTLCQPYSKRRICNFESACWSPAVKIFTTSTRATWNVKKTDQRVWSSGVPTGPIQCGTKPFAHASNGWWVQEQLSFCGWQNFHPMPSSSTMWTYHQRLKTNPCSWMSMVVWCSVWCANVLGHKPTSGLYFHIVCQGSFHPIRPTRSGQRVSFDLYVVESLPWKRLRGSRMKSLLCGGSWKTLVPTTGWLFGSCSFMESQSIGIMTILNWVQ